jgi:zinc and cadmium transporter
MSTLAWLSAYSAAILLVSLLGGCLPLLGRVTHGRLQLYLSLSAGVMLGASFFHVMPEALELAGAGFGWWMALGVVGLFGVERFLAPHRHETGGAPGQQAHDPACGHDHAPVPAPPVAGWVAVLGLTIHTFLNGVGLAGAVQVDADLRSAGAAPAGLASALPGLALFLAIILHKPADALAVSTVLARKGIRLRTLAVVQLGFAVMVPVGVVAFHLTRGAIARDLQGQLTGAALALSAGTFLLIALSDLLPEVQFHRHDRLALFLALALGVALMGGIAVLERHEHGKHAHPPAVQHERHEEQEPAFRP